MTIDELLKTSFRAGDKAEYKDEIRDIVQVDFEEKLIDLGDPYDFGNPVWVRCENCRFIPAPGSDQQKTNYSDLQLQKMDTGEVIKIANRLGIDYEGLTHQKLIYRILDKQEEQ